MLMSDETPSGIEFKVTQPTPKHSNASLRNFYASLDRTLPLILGESVEPSIDSSLGAKIDTHSRFAKELQGRTNSEVLEIMVGKLTRIIDPANTTDAFKDYVLNDLRARFLAGVGKRKNSGKSLPPAWTVGEDSLSDGVFASERGSVKPMERATYHQALDDSLGFQKRHSGLLRSIENNLTQLSELTGESYNIPRAPVDEILARWRPEFFERYGDEP